MSNSELRSLTSKGVRIAYHPENSSTRVVFDLAVTGDIKLANNGSTLRAVVTGERKTGPIVASSQPRTALPISPQLRVPPGFQGRLATRASNNAVPEPSQLEVNFNDGLLKVKAKSRLSEVLGLISRQIGADLDYQVPVDLSERVAVELGPASPVEVVRQLFAGSRYNYILISQPNDQNRIARIVIISEASTITAQTVQQVAPPPAAPSEPAVRVPTISGTPPLSDDEIRRSRPP